MSQFEYAKTKDNNKANISRSFSNGDYSFGFVSYICMLCLEVLKIGFTCKSRFCSKCGKKYVSQWVEKQEDKILDVPHRHCVFTMPEEFRNYFYWNKEKIKDLQDMVHEVVAEYANGVNKGNRAEYERKKKRKKGGELPKCDSSMIIKGR